MNLNAMQRKWNCLICREKCYAMKIDTLQFNILKSIKDLNLNIDEIIFDA